MRAKLVNENRDFQRGIDPRKKMDIGMSAVWKKIVDETSWGTALEPTVHEVEHVEEDYMGHPIMVISLKDPIMNKEYPYSGVSDFPGSFSTLHHSVNAALEGVKEKIRKREIRNYESVNFERGKDPSEALGVGKLANAQWDYEGFFHDTDIEEEYIYRGWPIRIYKRYLKDMKWGNSNSPFPEYAATSVKGVTNFGDRYILKWYKRKGYAKRHIQEAIDELEAYRDIARQIRERRTNESVNFERGVDPKEAMRLGYDPEVVYFLEWVKNDFQLDKGNPEYFGYINLSEDGFTDKKLKRSFVKFVNDYERHLPLMKRMGLYLLEDPWYDETIIYDDHILEKNAHHILESQNFERGQDPYDAMKIGQKALLKKRASEIDWDWYPDPSDEEEVLDIKKYKGFNVKIARIRDRDFDPDYNDEIYYAVSDTGEPYMDEPTFYKDPEDAWTMEQHFLDEFSEDQDTPPLPYR